jgi:alpha-1,6-mannosyltransferase
VPFGVDVQTFRPGARSEVERRRWLSAARPELGTSPAASTSARGTRLLVGVGRFAGEKRWDVVLEAFARIRRSHDAVLVLFGDGPERERLEAQAPPGVAFAGFERDRTHLARALASADVLVHGSPYETFGLSVAEAVACGLPVVVPDAGGAAESVDASCGDTYLPLDPSACASAVQRLLARDPTELRARALEAAARVTTVEQHVRRVVGTYEELLREKQETLSFRGAKGSRLHS